MAMQADHHGEGTLHANRHAGIRLHTVFDQVMRQAIGARVELAVGKRLVTRPGRWRRDRVDLFLEQLMDTAIGRIDGASVRFQVSSSSVRSSGASRSIVAIG
jgi:hypothetical protein